VGEKRKFRRYEYESPLQIKALTMDSSHVLHNSFSHDISAIGVGLTTFDFLPVNGKVYLRLFSKAWVCLLEIVGRVVWVKQLLYQNRFRVGIEFSCEDTGLAEKIRQVLSMDL